MKTLLFYVYREDELTKLNLKFFLKHGVAESGVIDYVFLINDYVCTVPIPEYRNVSVIKKDNSLDLAAFHVGLSSVDIEKYDAFIFMNSSCIGPFVPVYSQPAWYDSIINMLSESVKLVAPIIEVPPDDLGVRCLEELRYIKPGDTNVPFVHTYCFATDRAGLSILQRNNVFVACTNNKDEAIRRLERLTTACILNAGYSVRSLMLRYANVDFSNKANWQFSRWSNTTTTCPEVPGNYDGIDVDPFEIVFIKNLRFPHAHRLPRDSGIGERLRIYVAKYVSWQGMSSSMP
jgi:hypothetical protein